MCVNFIFCIPILFETYVSLRQHDEYTHSSMMVLRYERRQYKKSNLYMNVLSYPVSTPPYIYHFTHQLFLLTLIIKYIFLHIRYSLVSYEKWLQLHKTLSFLTWSSKRCWAWKVAKEKLATLTILKLRLIHFSRFLQSLLSHPYYSQRLI